MSDSTVKEVEFLKGRVIYTLNVNIDDPNDLVIEHVTITGTSVSALKEKDIDPDIFVDTLDEDDWEQIRSSLGLPA